MSFISVHEVTDGATSTVATTAAENLADLLQLVETEVPSTDQVTIKLMDFSDMIASEGVRLRDDMLKGGAYSVVCRAWLACCFSGAMDVPSPTDGAKECRDSVLRVLYALTAGNPEIIDEIGWQIISQALDKTNSEQTHILVLRLIRNVFIKSEENRENFAWNLGLVEPLMYVIARSNASSDLICEWCSAVKALLLSDDVRIVYNRAPERKRIIARTRVLPMLAAYLNEKELENNEGALNSVVVLLGTMATNEDICLHIESGNVFPGINAIFKAHAKNKTLTRNTISLLRYLCINQTLREKCSAYVLLKWVVECINYYRKEKDMVDVGLSCCAMMTLKSACQVSQLLNKNGLNLIYKCMNENDSDVTILKGALFTLRNICENTNAETLETIKEMYTDILRQFAVSVPEVKDYYVIPVLRALGLKETLANEGEEEDWEGDGEEEFHGINDILNRLDDEHGVGA